MSEYTEVKAAAWSPVFKKSRRLMVFPAALPPALGTPERFAAAKIVRTFRADVVIVAPPAMEPRRPDEALGYSPESEYATRPGQDALSPPVSPVIGIRIRADGQQGARLIEVTLRVAQWGHDTPR
ncbi:MAG: hypothetical protein O6941_00560 [Planctomycetota bacterium]|nr:hypothetical protein [Planctomycetota bacterium]